MNLDKHFLSLKVCLFSVKVSVLLHFLFLLVQFTPLSESSYPIAHIHLYPRPWFSLTCVKTQMCSQVLPEQGSTIKDFNVLAEQIYIITHRGYVQYTLSWMTIIFCNERNQLFIETLYHWKLFTSSVVYRVHKIRNFNNSITCTCLKVLK